MVIDMICTCGVDGVREAEARRLRIFKRMGLEDMSDLTLAICLSLAFDFQVTDIDVYSDMWFGVQVETPLVAQGLHVECDWPTDGLALIWETLAGLFPERVSVKPKTDPMCVRVMERISLWLLANYVRAEEAFRTHNDLHKDGMALEAMTDPCEDCSVFLSLSITMRDTLDEAWGSRDIEKVIEKAIEG